MDHAFQTCGMPFYHTRRKPSHEFHGLHGNGALQVWSSAFRLLPGAPDPGDYPRSDFRAMGLLFGVADNNPCKQLEDFQRSDGETFAHRSAKAKRPGSKERNACGPADQAEVRNGFERGPPVAVEGHVAF